MSLPIFDIYAKLSLDSKEYDEGIEEAKGKSSSLANTLLGGLGGIAAGVTAAVGAAAAGVTAIVKQSVDSYSNYEQLVGGVETLFKSSSDTVLENAQKAYMTAGISANEYMQTVTSFSESLIQSTGRGAQQDLAALQENLDKQYKEEKRHWEDRIALVKDSTEKTSLKRQMEDELEALKKHNKEVLAQAEEMNMASVTTEESLARAAELADLALTDMSDNANKMGTDMQAIQNAYQGFSKQNYTMLDNLKLGYGGTRAEMERLLQDAEKLAGKKFDLSSYADIVEAIHAIQVEMGITGTTAEEAMHTIEGSSKMVKAAWQDLLTSLAGGGLEVSEAIGNLVTSVEAYAQNIIPVVEQALVGIGQLITQLAPIIAERLPELLEQLVPMIIETAMYLVNSLITALPELLETLVQALIAILPSLIEAIVSIIDLLLVDILPLLAQFAMQLILALATSLAENAGMLIDGVVALILMLVQLLAENLPLILEAGILILQGIVEGLVNNLHLITDAIVILITALIQTIFEHLPEILLAAIEIGAKIVAGIVMAIPALIVSVGKMLGIVQDTKDQVTDHSNNMQSAVNTSTMGINSDINGMIENLNQKTNEARNTLSTSNREFTSVKDDMNKKADDLNNTAKDVQRQMTISFGGIRDIVQFARAAMDQGFEQMTESMMRFEEKFRELGAMQAAPTVDASGVVDACQEIVEAVEDALEALADLANASGGGGGGFGGGHAKGGWMQAGTTYLVGELGPELVTPSRSGYVHTAEETASMLGRGQSINITIQGDVYDNAYSMRKKLRNAMLDVLQEQVVYG